jgi:hypothetical protein
MTNNQVISLIESVLLDLDTKAYDNAESTLKSLLLALKGKAELNELKRIVYEKMQYCNTRDKKKNKALYEFYQGLKNLSEKDFDFADSYIKYLEILK